MCTSIGERVWERGYIRSHVTFEWPYMYPFSTGLIYAAPLETLNLSTNALSGSINFLWGNKGIKQFDVSNNRLTGEMPYLVSQQPSLRLLNLGGNKCVGCLCTSICSLLALILLTHTLYATQDVWGPEQLPVCRQHADFLQCLWQCTHQLHPRQP
jgi:hypothetical protein